MKIKHIIVIGLLLAPFCLLQAQIPRTLAYQGIVTDAASDIKPDGTYSFTFKLYDGLSGGTALWTEVKTLEVKDGLFSTVLGDQVVFPAALVFDKPYWLGIQLASEAELAPRIPLNSVGYSFAALRADSAHHAVRADTASYAAAIELADGSVTSAKILDGAVGTADLASQSVTAEKIAGASATSGQALMYNGTDVVWQTPAVSTGSITTAELGDNAVTSAKIADSTITGTDISGSADVNIAALTTSGSIAAGAGLNVSGDVNVGGLVTLPTTTRYYSIPAVSFIPTNHLATYNLYMYGNAVFPSSGSAYFYAPVHLPQGATITQFEPIIYDNSANNITFRLVGVDNSGGYSVFTTVTSAGASTAVRSISPGALSETIDNQTNAYLVYASWSTPATASDMKDK